MNDVVIVGAGISGLSCARVLHDKGLRVLIFEKSHRPGGRCSSKETSIGFFNHGAQYFTARKTEFVKVVTELCKKKVVREIGTPVMRLSKNGEIIPLENESRFVGYPCMEAIPREISKELPISYSSKVIGVTRKSDSWEVNVLRNNLESTVYSKNLVLAVPVEQALELYGSSLVQEKVSEIKMEPCWALMLGFKNSVSFSCSALMMDEKNDQPVSWIMRTFPETEISGIADKWCLHAGPKWSRKYEKMKKDMVIDILFQNFKTITGCQHFDFADAKFWRYASGGRGNNFSFIHEESQKLTVCGDWANGGRIEGAWISGLDAAITIGRSY